MRSDIKRLYPAIYDGVLETDALTAIDDKQFNDWFEEMDWAHLNQWIRTADEAGVAAFEALYEIQPNPITETLDFRRQRVINRMRLQPPYTIRFLRQRLDDIIGAGRYECWVDANAYTLYVDATTEDFSWFHEVRVTINRIKPANIVFAFTPLVAAELWLSEGITMTRAQWNYKLNGRWKLGLEPFGWDHATEVIAWHYQLDGSWRLGEKPFGITRDPEVLKLPAIPSIQPPFLADHARFSAEDVAKARINDTLDIDVFVEKAAAGDTATIRYMIPEDAGITEIVNIKLLNAAGQVLTNAPVYTPVADMVTIRHRIMHKEGT